MRGILCILVLSALFVPGAVGVGGAPIDDGAMLLTAAEPLRMAVQVSQTQQVVLQGIVMQGAFQGLEARLEERCSDSTDAGGAAALASEDGREAFGLYCGRLEAGWYVLTVSIEAGAARIRFEGTNAEIYPGPAS